MLRITEEILLLVLDAAKGHVELSLPSRSRDIVLAGAVLMDLALERRIDTDLQHLVLINSTPLGDDLLDPTLADLARNAGTRDTTFWITHIAERSNQIREQALGRLVAHGILESEDNGIFSFSRLVSRIRRYPAVDEQAVEDVEFRIMRVIFSHDIPDPRDTLIIALASACGIFETILSPEELNDVRERIDQISRLELIGRTVISAIRRIPPPAPRRTAIRPVEEIPQVSGWPLIGSAFEMAGDLRRFLTRQYLKHGSIFRIQAANRRFVALVGPEANLFVTNSGQTHLRSFEFWRDFDAATGVMHTVMSMDGDDHLRMRKVQAQGYSPKIIQERLGEVVSITRREIATWPAGEAVPVQHALQRIVAEQIGLLLTNLSPQDYLDDLLVFLEMLLRSQVTKQRPRQMLYLPRFRRARKRVLELYAELLRVHQPDQRGDRSPDYIDALLDLNRSDPQFFPETDFLIAFLGPYFAGLDTSASVCSFMLYALLTQPELLARMTAEVDAMFERGTLTAHGLRELDVTHRIAIETLRAYPVIPAVTRIVSNSFEFGGYRVPAGTQVIIGNTVGHHLPECFPDPERFDIDRYQPGRAEHRRPGAFAPFGLGRHRCLGFGFAEVQIAATMATIVRELELQMERPERPLKIKRTPLPHPAPSFRVRVVRRRSDGAGTARAS